MKKFWSYIKVIASAIVGVFLIVFIKKKSEEEVKTVQKDIEKNNNKIKNLKEKREQLERKKDKIKHDVDKRRIKINDLKKEREKVKVEENSVTDALKHLKEVGRNNE